jgi:hypothetical protein
MENLIDLYKWFDANRDTIINDHLNECVLLKDDTVIGYYSNTETVLLMLNLPFFRQAYKVCQEPVFPSSASIPVS